MVCKYIKTPEFADMLAGGVMLSMY